MNTVKRNEMFRRKAEERNKMIVVCAWCLRASCWQGEFYCNQHKKAGTTEMSLSELVELGKESPHYWGEETTDVE